MVLTLYQLPFSAPCVNVVLTAKQLGLDLELKPLNLMEGEHMKPEFLKINPFHCIPTLMDDGFALWESKAIMCYLANKYAPKNPAYPSDPQARAVVDRWLHYDGSSLYSSLAGYYGPIIREGAPPNLKARDTFLDKVALVDSVLADSTYLCGDSLTLADLSLICTISLASALEFDMSKHQNVNRWVETLLKELPYLKEIIDPMKEGIGNFVKSKMTK